MTEYDFYPKEIYSYEYEFEEEYRDHPIVRAYIEFKKELDNYIENYVKDHLPFPLSPYENPSYINDDDKKLEAWLANIGRVLSGYIKMEMKND